MKQRKGTKRDIQRVRTQLLLGIGKCDNIPSSAALAALIELTVDTAIALTGKRALALEGISEAVNLVMLAKYGDYDENKTA